MDHEKHVVLFMYVNRIQLELMMIIPSRGMLMTHTTLSHWAQSGEFKVITKDCSLQ